VILEAVTRKNRPAITSDRWHVLIARRSASIEIPRRFERVIVSEHADHESAAAAAREMVAQIAPEMAARPRTERDQVLVRRPMRKSLKLAKRVVRRTK
jgi:hypothetical protein